MQVLIGAMLMKAGAGLAASGNPVLGYGLFRFGWNEFYAGMQGLLEGRPHENELTAQAKVGAEMLGLDPRGVDILKIVIELFGPFVQPKPPAPGALKPKPRAKVPEKLPGQPDAHSAAELARLKEFYRLSEEYGAGGIQHLPNGRFRFYGKVKPADKPGTMAGTRLVREWDPATGKSLTWFETLDNMGRIRIVREDILGVKVHFMYDEVGNLVEIFFTW
jgi:hypothetical protein